MAVKLQTMRWNSTKDTKSNIDSALTLPETFSITEVNTNIAHNYSQKKYSTFFTNKNYTEKRIQINGTIFDNSSLSLPIVKKDEIISYCNIADSLMMKIYQDSDDTRHWIGKLETSNIIYIKKRSQINLSLTFILEEPFQLDDTKTSKTFASSSDIISDSINSTVDFYPEKISFVTTGLTGLTIYPLNGDSTLDGYTMSYNVTDTGDVLYPKTFKGDLENLSGDYEKFIKILAGSYRYTKTGGTINVDYYKRFL